MASRGDWGSRKGTTMVLHKEARAGAYEENDPARWLDPAREELGIVANGAKWLFPVTGVSGIPDYASAVTPRAREALLKKKDAWIARAKTVKNERDAAALLVEIHQVVTAAADLRWMKSGRLQGILEMMLNAAGEEVLQPRSFGNARRRMWDRNRELAMVGVLYAVCDGLLACRGEYLIQPATRPVGK